MKRFILPLTLLFFLVFTGPANALSDLADRFILQCRQFDTTFPPDDWSDTDLRSSALEVLDAYENGTGEDWTVHFCLVTLGYTENSDDVPRILAYEETLTDSVIRAFKGFPDEGAIDCLLRHLDSDSAGMREQVIYGLADVDFESMENGNDLRDLVVERLSAWKENEEFDLLVELIEDTIETIEMSGSLVN